MKRRMLLTVLRRGSWLIVLVAIVSGSLAYLYFRSQPLEYRASSVIQIGWNGHPVTDIDSVKNYIALIKTVPVLVAVVQKLNLPFAVDTLAGLFRVEQITNTSLLTITVTFTDPNLTANIVNELAAELINFTPSYMPPALGAQLTLLQGEVLKADTQLKAAQEELTTIEDDLGSNTPQSAALMERRDELVKNISLSQANLEQIHANVLTLNQQRQNCCNIIDPARMPNYPITLSPFLSAFAAALTSAILVFVIALGIESINSKKQSAPK